MKTTAKNVWWKYAAGPLRSSGGIYVTLAPFVSGKLCVNDRGNSGQNFTSIPCF
jgi:hypothetical protein